MSKADIETWQRHLNAHGYEVKVDGDFGPETLRKSLKYCGGEIGGNGSHRVTDDQLIVDLKRDEGFRSHAYPDPLSGGDPWTIGYGATGKGIQKGTVWTMDKAEARLLEMAEDHAKRLEERLPWVASLDPVRRRVLHNMAYNLGVDGLLKFKNTLEFVRTNQFEKAAANMMESLWARQVGQRAVRLALQMRTGT